MGNGLKVSLGVNIICLLLVGGISVFTYEKVTILTAELREAKTYASNEILKVKESISNARKVITADYKELKDRIIVNTIEERRSNLNFANSLLDLVQNSGGTIVNRNLALPNNVFLASEWAGSARIEARAISVIAHDHQEIISTLASAKFGDSWLIEIKGKKRVKLYDWLLKSDIVQSERLNKKQHRTP